MIKSVFATACIFAGLLIAQQASAGPVGNACMSSRNASAGTCGCIDRVANQTLSNSDQRRAAGFFKDPDKAQQVRMSTRPSDNDFWARYKTFAETAENYCAG